MDDYLAKPLQAAELFAAIERQIHSGGASRTDSGIDRGLLAPAVLLAACDGDPEALRARCQDFRTYLPGRLAEVSAALQAGDAPQLREAAHKLCGLLSVFSTAAAAVASDLEDRAAEGRLAESQELLQKLDAMTSDLLRQLDGLSIEALRSQAGAVGRS
jgi:HPt (histidine-containing phosphotransfer) domain-containing protein